MAERTLGSSWRRDRLSWPLPVHWIWANLFAIPTATQQHNVLPSGDRSRDRDGDRSPKWPDRLILCGNQWGAPRFHQNCQRKVGGSIGSLSYSSMCYGKPGVRSTSNGPEEWRSTIGRDGAETSVKWQTSTLARRRKRALCRSISRDHQPRRAISNSMTQQKPRWKMQRIASLLSSSDSVALARESWGSSRGGIGRPRDLLCRLPASPLLLTTAGNPLTKHRFSLSDASSPVKGWCG